MIDCLLAVPISQGKYGDLDSTMVSYGPCQTPTLGFCVDRHDEIVSFVPEDFWVLEADVSSPRGVVPLAWDRGRVFDHDVRRPMRDCATMFHYSGAIGGGVMHRP